jgi:hypothetical protein
MSAPEEDKAEIYAGLFRHAPALLQSDDPVIARKALEMKYNTLQSHHSLCVALYQF